MEAKRDLVIALYKQKYRNIDILRRLQNLQVNYKFIQRTISRYKETGSVKIRHNGGRKRTVTTPAMIKRIREKIRRDPRRSARKLAKEEKVHEKTMRRVIHRDLHMKTYKKQCLHGLTETNKKNRVTRSKALLSKHAKSEIIFSDEKLFFLQSTLNKQNDRVYGTSLQEIPRDARTISKFQNHSAVMVFGAISKRGKLPLLFIDRGVKINQNYYLNEVLKKFVFPEAKKLYGNERFCFQQDSAPAHKAKLVQQWCTINFPDFISSDEWPAASPDLNPLDFCVWGYMMGKLTNLNRLHLESFKCLLTKIWDEIPPEVCHAACGEFTERLKEVIKQKGECIE